MDYDDTYSSDPSCFRAVIRCFQSCGHKVYIVTMRSKELDWSDEFDFLKKNYGVDTIFCDGVAKKEVTEQAGIEIDWWLDDRPEGINNGSNFSGSDLIQWRNDQIANGGITEKKVA